MKTISLYESFARGYLDQRQYALIHKQLDFIVEANITGTLARWYELDHMTLAAIDEAYSKRKELTGKKIPNGIAGVIFQHIDDEGTFY